MSETVEIWPEIEAICEKVGLDPNVVALITVHPDCIQFTVYATSDDGLKKYPCEFDVVTRPWSRKR